MADRQWFVEGVQVHEDDTDDADEYFMEGIQLSEEEAAGGGATPTRAIRLPSRWY